MKSAVFTIPIKKWQKSAKRGVGNIRVAILKSRLMPKKIKMQRINWHKIALKKHLKDVFSSGITYAILALVFLLWRFALGYQFEWQSIEPFQQPSIFIRVFYSAFTFLTLGYLLYIAYFYKVLHDILVKSMGLWSLYNGIKAIVWAFLMFVSYQYIVPWLFSVLNAGVSILFNIANLVLYALPPVGISLVLSVIYFLLKNENRKTS
ncbi:hypothetical protein A3G16_03295 [Candidatus Curtissbacteria bacterium RIFCSPLOWO2_12_FULL_41_16]|uniref:Uncharacterized protein n=1 Tax=Candidatus Zambryskibacteria bacterium RIFCSPHIGHO2_02_38_10.5 TaxID=1802742 RepID=A0A1G2T7X0_9BACT|nr:MAG: hypothetical protein A3G16_03295 [Candidatus Curtissbacteria bacterium RIFCSPLOWO2_12_FULL_41_16]OHA93377.1 MAG: hypothetical protein A2W58_00780 [Candidatus Zambryskibacteria bacterium RIFCSPHIGHO2_02_38_10.5]